jgi:hypothetical protein
MMIHAQTPSVTQLALASGTPLYRDPYRKVGQALPGNRRSVLLDDPIETVGEVGTHTLMRLLFELLGRARGTLPLVSAGPISELATRASLSSQPQHSLLADAHSRAALINDDRVREQAIEALERLSAYLPKDSPQLPPFVLSRLDDGSVYIEWPLPGRRLGFAVQPTRSESGWFFVSDADCGNIMASGALNEAPMEQLVGWAANPPKNSK